MRKVNGILLVFLLSVTATVASATRLKKGPGPTPTHVHCETLYAPTAQIQLTDDIDSIWRAPAAVTLTNVWCESPTGTATIDLQRDDGSAADIHTAALTCASTPVDACASGCTTTLVDAEDNLADGDRIDLEVTGVAGNPTTLNVCWEYQYD